MGFRLGKWVMPIVALQSVLCVLELLDSFEVTIYPMVHRATMERTFSLGFSLVGVVVVLMLATSWYLVEEGRIREVLMGLLASIFLYLFVDFGVSVSMFSLFLVGITLMRGRRFQGYFTCLLALLAVCARGVITVLLFLSNTTAEVEGFFTLITRSITPIQSITFSLEFFR